MRRIPTCQPVFDGSIRPILVLTGKLVELAELFYRNRAHVLPAKPACWAIEGDLDFWLDQGVVGVSGPLKCSRRGGSTQGSSRMPALT